MATNSTNAYETLINKLGYDSAGNVGFVRGDALREKAPDDGLDDRRFRYASVLDPQKLGVTDVFEINGAPCIYMKSLGQISQKSPMALFCTWMIWQLPIFSILGFLKSFIPQVFDRLCRPERFQKQMR